MASNLRLFSSESVTEGHPDKICDSISDSILDAMLAQDSASMVAVETVVTTGLVHVVGEVRTQSYVDIPGIVRSRLKEIGFDSSEKGFDGKTCGVSISIGEQSSDINDGVHTSLEARSSGGEVEAEDLKGAGDQGLMFGYATNETPEYMPLPIALAHRLARRLTQVRKEGIVPSLRPDGKTQVTFAYDEDNNPVYLDTVVVSTQHDPDVTQEWITEQIKTHVVDWVLDDANLRERFVTEELKLLVNPSGQFIIGGPMGDAGLTGRKIIVDTYGGYARHGGGAFSGKDCTKVDRSAAYAARYAAKNIVAAGLADKCEIQLSYAIGVAKPTSVRVDTFGTGKLSDSELVEIIRENFDLRPAGIIRMLNLRRPIYKQTAAYGHFGRNDLDLPWEKTDKVETLKAYLR